MLYYIWLNRERNRLCKKNKKTTNMESKQNIPLAEQKREQMPKHNIKKLLTLFRQHYISVHLPLVGVLLL